MKQNTKILPPMYVGIDVAKNKFDICAIDSYGKKLSKFKISADRKGFNKLITDLPSNYQPSFGLEATGPYSGNLLAFLRKTNCEVICSNPYEVSRLREAFYPGVKNDKIDAYVLAQSLRMGVLKGSQKDDKYVFLGDLLERNYNLTDKETQITNSLRSSLNETFPEIESVFSDIACNASLAILSHYQTPCDLQTVDFKTIRKLVLSQNGRMSEDKFKELKALSKGSVAWKQSSYHKFLIESQVQELKTTIELTKDVKDKIVEYMAEESLELQEKQQLLQTIPGVGDKTSLLLLAVLGDPKRFDPKSDGQGAQRVAAFVGFGIKEYSSGKLSFKKGISKRGNPRLRGSLYMAAMNAVKRDEDLKKRHNRAKKNGKSAKKSLVNIAHTLVKRCYGVLKSMQPYNPAIPMLRGIKGNSPTP